MKILPPYLAEPSARPAGAGRGLLFFWGGPEGAPAPLQNDAGAHVGGPGGQPSASGSGGRRPPALRSSWPWDGSSAFPRRSCLAPPGRRKSRGKTGKIPLPGGKPLDKRGNAHKINLLSAWMGRKPGRPSSESRRPLRAGGGALGYWPRSVSPESTSRAGRQAAVTGHGPLGAAERRPGDRRRDQGGTAFSNAPEPLGSGAFFRKGKMLR